MAITAGAHQEMKDWLKAKIAYGTYTIGSTVTQMLPDSVELAGDVITVVFTIADNVSGTITKFQIIDKNGAVFDDQPDSITKPATNGLTVTFKYTLKRV